MIAQEAKQFRATSQPIQHDRPGIKMGARIVRNEQRERKDSFYRWMLAKCYPDFLTALSTSVLPSDQIAPGTLWLAAMTSSNDFSIQLQSSSVITSGGASFVVWVAGAGDPAG